MVYLGVDPGQEGSVAVLGADGKVLSILAFKTKTEREISDFFFRWSSALKKLCMLELVHSMPKQGVASSFKFGQSYGFLRGVLVAHRIPFHEVRPNAWQKTLGCLSGGKKKVTRQKAQQLFPDPLPDDQRITNQTADALLIAEYARTFTVT